MSIPLNTLDIKAFHDNLVAQGGKKIADRTVKALIGYQQAGAFANLETLQDINKMKKGEWKRYIQQSYTLVKNKLSAN